MRAASESINRCNRLAVLQGRHPRPDICDAGEVDVGEMDPASVAGVEQHLAPRVDHQAVTIGAAAVLMLAALGCECTRPLFTLLSPCPEMVSSEPTPLVVT